MKITAGGRTAASVSYFRNFVFGVEDSLVSTVGLLSGVAIADASRQTIFLTGTILILVEAFSMAAGSFLSEYSADSYASHTEKTSRGDVASAVIMFFSYLISGLVPLLPYMFMPVDQAIWFSAGLSLACLLLLGIIGARISGIRVWRNAFRMLIVGGAAIAVGALAGALLPPIA